MQHSNALKKRHEIARDARMQLAQPRARAAAAVTGACSHQPTAPCDTARARVRAFAYARHRTCACRRCCGRRRLTAAESLGVRVVAVTSPSSRRRRGVVASPAGIAGLESSALTRSITCVASRGHSTQSRGGQARGGQSDGAVSAHARDGASRGWKRHPPQQSRRRAPVVVVSARAGVAGRSHLRVQQRSQQGVRG